MYTTAELQSLLFRRLALDPDRKREVAIYGRVSTQHEAQVNALENQMQWYEDQVCQHKNWTVVDRYIDEGITGTSAKKRPNFMRMIEDAKKHKFDLIVTREVCRFARNTVDTLVITRELKNFGVEVYFVSDNIWTMDNDGELRLTIMATMAQEESRKISERVLAGQKISRDNGVLYGNGNILGYDRDPISKTYVINPEQAETVKLIYELYAQNLGMKEIANELTCRGRKKAGGKINWECVEISRTLRNPTYMGRICYNKSRVNNFIEKKRINNLDESTFEIKEADFPPIVSSELWHRCEAIRKSRQTQYTSRSGETRKKGIASSKDLWGQRLRCRCAASMGKYKWRVLTDGTPVFGYQCRRRTGKLCKTLREEQDIRVDALEACDAISVCQWKLELMAKKIFDQIWGDQKAAVLQACQMLDVCNKAISKTNIAASTSLLQKIEKAKARLHNYAVMRADGEITREQFLSLSESTAKEIETFKKELAEGTPEFSKSQAIDLQRVTQALSSIVDISGPKISEALIAEFVEVITPVEDYRYRWKLNFGKRKLGTERADLMSPDAPPILSFTIDFNTAKEFRKENKMPTQFRQSAWNDLYVEVYL